MLKTAPFTLSVTHEGQRFEFPSELHRFGLQHHFVVMVNDRLIVYQPDKKRRYSTTASADYPPLIKDTLLVCIADKLEEIFGNS